MLSTSRQGAATESELFNRTSRLRSVEILQFELVGLKVVAVS